MSPTRVLISGAGIAGPALAFFLAQAGAQVTVVEKSKELLSYGQNIDISGSAIQVIKKMGLLDEVRKCNTTEGGTQFIDPNGKPFAQFPVKKGSSSSPTSEFEILRGDLAIIFYNATKDLPNVEYQFDTTVQNVISNDDDSVKVEMSNGQKLEFDILVAADGQWSKLRKQCFSPDDVKVVDKGLYTVYWTTPRLESDDNWWKIYHALGSRVITLRPDPYNTIRACVTRMPCNEAQKKAWYEASKGNRQAQHEHLRKEFADAGWQAQRLLDSMDQAPDFYFQTISQIRMTKWSTGRVICLGDAAFAPTPLTGMGTSLAITSAYLLAGELSKLDQDQHPSKAFDSFETAFRPFVEKTQNIPSFVPSIAHPATAWKRWLLQSVIQTASWVASISWVVNIFAGANDSEDFPLPKYEVFEQKGSGEGLKDLQESNDGPKKDI